MSLHFAVSVSVTGLNLILLAGHPHHALGAMGSMASHSLHRHLHQSFHLEGFCKGLNSGSVSAISLDSVAVRTAFRSSKTLKK